MDTLAASIMLLVFYFTMRCNWRKYRRRRKALKRQRRAQRWRRTNLLLARRQYVLYGVYVRYVPYLHIYMVGCVLCMYSTCFYLHRLSILQVFGSRSRVSPSIWCRQRVQEWWSGVIAGVYGGAWWRENLRMT